jgi:hypothetical protein
MKAPPIMSPRVSGHSLLHALGKVGGVVTGSQDRRILHFADKALTGGAGQLLADQIHGKKPNQELVNQVQAAAIFSNRGGQKGFKPWLKEVMSENPAEIASENALAHAAKQLAKQGKPGPLRRAYDWWNPPLQGNPKAMDPMIKVPHPPKERPNTFAEVFAPKSGKLKRDFGGGVEKFADIGRQDPMGQMLHARLGKETVPLRDTQDLYTESLGVGLRPNLIHPRTGGYQPPVHQGYKSMSNFNKGVGNRNPLPFRGLDPSKNKALARLLFNYLMKGRN